MRKLFWDVRDGDTFHVVNTSIAATKMPLPFLAEVISKGLPLGLKWWDVIQVVVGVGLIVLIKMYSGGRANRSERTMHSKVIMITVSAAYG